MVVLATLTLRLRCDVVKWATMSLQQLNLMNGKFFYEYFGSSFQNTIS